MTTFIAVLALCVQDRLTYEQALDRGTKLVKERKYKEAVPVLRAMLRAKSDAAPVWALLGLCHLKLRQWDQAKSALEVARDLEPWRKRFARELGYAYIGTLEWAKAEQQLLEAREVFPDDASISFKLGMVYMKLRKPAQARTELQRAEKLAPILLPMTRLLIVQTYVEERDLSAARDQNEAARELFGQEIPERPIRRQIPAPPRAEGRLRLASRNTLEYDSNVLFLADSAPTPGIIDDRNDWKFVNLTQAEFDVLAEGPWRASVNDTFYHSFHFEETRANYLSNRIGAAVEYRLSPKVSTGFNGGYRYDELDRRGALQIWDTETRLRWFMSDRWWSDVSFGYDLREFFADNVNPASDRDGREFEIRAALGRLFERWNTLVYGGAAYRNFNTDGPDYDGYGVDFFVQAQAQFNERLSASAYVQYSPERYERDNSLAVTPTNRQDDRFLLQLQARVNLCPHTDAVVYLRYHSVDSNIALFSADQTVFGFGVEVYGGFWK
jgi:hypothetical protein